MKNNFPRLHSALEELKFFTKDTKQLPDSKTTGKSIQTTDARPDPGGQRGAEAPASSAEKRQYSLKLDAFFYCFPLC